MSQYHTDHQAAGVASYDLMTTQIGVILKPLHQKVFAALDILIRHPTGTCQYTGLPQYANSIVYAELTLDLNDHPTAIAYQAQLACFGHF